MDSSHLGVDTPLKLVNQAAIGVWWGQLNADKWRFILILLYNVVNDLGRQLSEVGTYTSMQQSEFAAETSLNDYLFKVNPLSTDAQTKMFHDKIYGLYNLDNFGKWGALNPNADD